MTESGTSDHPGDRPLPRFVAFGEALTDLIRGEGEQWLAAPGGAPWNVARAMAALGIDSAFAGAISSDCFGDALWRESENAGLDRRFLQRYEKAPLLAVVHELRPPQYFFVGNDSADLHFDDALLPAGWEGRLGWACFGGISLARPPLAQRLLRVAERLKVRGVSICYDPNYRIAMTEAYDPMLLRMAALADVIKVSEEDLCGLFRVDDPATGLCKLRAMQPATVILLTRGGQGAALYAGERQWQAAPPPVTVVDTVGAGDCAVAGLLHHRMTQPRAGWGDSLRAAIAAGTGACLMRGAMLPPVATLDELAGAIQVVSN